VGKRRQKGGNRKEDLCVACYEELLRRLRNAKRRTIELKKKKRRKRGELGVVVSKVGVPNSKERVAESAGRITGEKIQVCWVVGRGRHSNNIQVRNQK